MLKEALEAKSPAKQWSQILRVIWFINSINTNLLEANYQLQELEKILPEFRMAMDSLGTREREKVSRILVRNSYPLKEFLSTWEQVRKQWDFCC